MARSFTMTDKECIESVKRIFPKVRRVLFKTEESRKEVKNIAEKLRQVGRMGLLEECVFADINKKMATSIKLQKHILSHENNKITIDVAKDIEKTLDEDEQISDDVMLGVKFIQLYVKILVEMQ
jgi:hypothetical protein